MAKKGGSSHLKRISSYRSLTVAKKTHDWIIKPGPGPHSNNRAIPLGVLVRDYLGLASTSKEMKYILNNGEAFVDGRKVKSPNFPVGLMDVVSLSKIGKAYRVGIDSHERLVLNEITHEEAGLKLCKIKSKRTLSTGKLMLGLHDGKSIPGDNNYKVGDTVKITLPGNKVERLLKLAPGARCLIVKGKHAGKLCSLKELRVVGNRKCEAHMEVDGGNFITSKGLLFVVE